MHTRVAEQIKTRIRRTSQPATPFMSRTHALAMQALEQGVNEGQGVTVMVGEAGVGKTTILSEFLRRSDERRLLSIQLPQAPADFDSVLQALAEGLGLSTPSPELPLIHQALIDAYLVGRRVVLILDDAHQIPVDVLAQLPKWAGLETNGERLLQMVVVGRSELADTMDQPALESLLPHLAAAVQLSPLSEDEITAFIRHQFRDIIDTDGLFSKSALACLAQYARGIPRDLSILCTDVIHVAMAERKIPIRLNTVKEILGDYHEPRQLRQRFKPRLRLPRWVLAGTATAVMIAGVAMGTLSFYPSKPVPVTAQKTVTDRPEAPAPTPQRIPSQEVTAGKRGEHVRQLQQELAAAGFNPGPIDGIMGPQTELALRRFQAANGLTDSKQLRRAAHKDVQL